MALRGSLAAPQTEARSETAGPDRGRLRARRLAVLLRWNVNATWLIAAAAAVGWAGQAFGVA